MNKLNRKLIISIFIFVVLIVISSLYLKKLTSFNNDDVEVFDETINIENKYDNIISNETVNDLINNLGKGVNNDYEELEELTNELGETVYIYHYNDGTSQKITIRNVDNLTPEDFNEIDDENNLSEQALDEDNQDDSSDTKEDSVKEKFVPEGEPGTVYERYLNMSSTEQYAFYRCFDNRKDFLEWLEAAQKEYENLHPEIVVGSGQIVDFSNN
ncbi:MAG: hypothetical protein Q4F12_04210 [Erysipelotrichaceae bacterium]|nr:hypothetical protein [Erysipelotrichaceae bacterium]